ncbi:MAG: helix-turn-helix domain-containing protein [Clostridia bacterium]|nr:helix-turn-helix domain-containing protein [Clostridia bacterium]
MNTFGDFLYTLRKERGMTQAELAEALGVTNKAVSKWETGEAMPETAQLLPISRIFGVTVDELLDGKRAETTGNDRESGKKDEELFYDEIKKHMFTRGKDEEPKTFLEKVCGLVCTAVMFAGITVYLFLGALYGLWNPHWVIIPVCALSCGITGIIFDLCNEKKRAIKKAKGENPYTGGICGLVMLTAIIAYILAGAFASLWHPLWIILAGAGLVCGVIGAIGELTKNSDKK